MAYMVLSIQLDRFDLPEETIRNTDLVTIGGARQGGAITVNTSETELVVHETITCPGMMYVRNYSDTVNQYVSIGYLPGQSIHRIYEGEQGLIPLHPGQRSLFVKASSGTLKFEYEITERSGVLTTYEAVDTAGDRMIWTDGSYWTWTE